MKKRLLSIFIAISMSISLVPVIAFATESKSSDSAMDFYTGTNTVISQNGDLYAWGDIGVGGETPKVISQNIDKVYVDYLQIAAIKNNGDLHMWGSWGSLQYLAQGLGNQYPTMDGEKILSNVKDVDLGDAHGAAITNGDTLYIWGANYNGQIGDGTTENRCKPVRILANVDSVILEESYSAAITSDNNLYIWGDNCVGQVGNGTINDQLIPYKVLTNVSEVKCADLTVAALLKDGSLYMWGENNCGQVGNGTTNNQLVPLKVLSDVKCVELSEYGDSVAALTKSGDLYTWGANYYGQIGVGTNEEIVNKPKYVMSNVSKIEMGGSISAALTKSGDLFMWGYNGSGNLGDGTTTNRNEPIKVLSSVAMVEITEQSAAVTKDGSLFMWGDNSFGAVGAGEKTLQLEPKKVLEGVVDYCNGGDCSGAITENGDFYFWGSASQFRMEGAITRAPQKLLSDARLPNSSGNDEYYIRVCATDGDMNIDVGEYFTVYCNLYKNGQNVTNWKNPSISFDNSQIVKISEYTIEDGRCKFNVKGKKEGTTRLTVEDPNTGAVATVEITVGERVPWSYKMNTVPEFYPNAIGDKQTLTNFYNMNDLYVNNFSYWENDDGSYTAYFNVYNGSNMYGSIDIYDSNGRWIESKRIDRYEEIGGIVDTLESGIYLVKDLVIERDGLSYSSGLHSAINERITINVPAGGHFTISNNCAESPGAYLYNSVYFMILGAQTAIEVAFGDVETESIIDQVVNAASKKPEFLQLFIDKFQNIAMDLSGSILTVGYGAAANSLTVTAEELLDQVKVDWREIVINSAGIGESAFESFAGPPGAALKLLFMANTKLDNVYHLGDIMQSVDAPFATIYTPDVGQVTTVQGVTVIPQENGIDPDASLRIFRVPNSDEVIVAPDGLYTGDSELYNISYVKEDVEVQPNGKVTIKIPVPPSIKGDECIVYRQEKDGRWSIIEARVDGEYVVFETDHFSLYAVASGDVELVKDAVMYVAAYRPNGQMIGCYTEKVTLTGKDIPIKKKYGEAIYKAFLLDEDLRPVCDVWKKEFVTIGDEDVFDISDDVVFTPVMGTS